MSDPQSPLIPAAEAQAVTMDVLVEAHQSLRRSFHVSLVMILLLAGSLFVFFLRELSIARQQTEELSKVVADYEKNTAPNVEKFRKALQAFAQTHPDFAPIYSRYFSSNSVASSNNDDSNVRMPPPGER
jgi:hypothetical protein